MDEFPEEEKIDKELQEDEKSEKSEATIAFDGATIAFEGTDEQDWA